MKLKYAFFYYFIVSETFYFSVQSPLIQRSKQLELVTNARTNSDTHTHSLPADYCYECISNYCDRQRRITSPGKAITITPGLIDYRISNYPFDNRNATPSRLDSQLVGRACSTVDYFAFNRPSGIL